MKTPAASGRWLPSFWPGGRQAGLGSLQGTGGAAGTWGRREAGVGRAGRGGKLVAGESSI